MLSAQSQSASQQAIDLGYPGTVQQKTNSFQFLYQRFNIRARVRVRAFSDDWARSIQTRGAVRGPHKPRKLAERGPYGPMELTDRQTDRQTNGTDRQSPFKPRELTDMRYNYLPILSAVVSLVGTWLGKR